MRKIRAYFIVLCVLMGAAGSAQAWVSININLFPELVPVPGYPVYYAPRMSANYFFYDGMYWVYEDDDWYVSDWYNGPWEYVDPIYVPVYVLRIPVRYYRRPPVYFREWRADAPPRWGYHWGREWESRRSGWDHWDRARVPSIAPLPVYQRQYSGDRYPRVEEQREIRSNNYRYQPRNAMVRERYESPAREVHESARENRYERQSSMPSAQQQWPTRRDSTRQDSMRQEPMRQEQMQRETSRQSREFNSRGNNGNGSDSPPDRGRGQDRGRNDDRGGH
ncbi:MAG: hypothetical protein QM709_13965 [Spongiibacteraceae bacterium]